MTTNTTSSTLLPRPAPHHRLWTAVVRHARDHHESVNAAYTAYYGPGTATSRGNSRGSLPSSSSSSAFLPAVIRKASWSSSSTSSFLVSAVPGRKRGGEEEEALVPAAAEARTAPSPRQYAGRAWRAVKRRAREHHESVEASYSALYGR